MKFEIKRLITKGLIPDWLDHIFFKSVTPFIKFFSLVKINPNCLTFMGFILNVIASFFIVYAYFLTACVFIIIGGIFDFIDGKVAKSTHKITKSGAILDSVLDRYSDIVIYLGIAIYYIRNDFNITAAATIIALIGSFLTSYVKAIGASHGFQFRIGALRRQERITLISIGLFFTFIHNSIVKLFLYMTNLFHVSIDNIPILPLSFVVYFLAVLTNFSSIQRFIFLLKMSNRADTMNEQ